MGVPDYWQQFPEVTERKEFACRSVTASDGVKLTLYNVGGAPRHECLVVIVPTSTPALLLSRVIARLAQRLPVIAWEPRGATFLPETFAPEPMDWRSVTVERHVQDLNEILSLMGVRAAHLVTWCSSVDIAAYAIQDSRMNILSVAAIAPTLTYTDSSTSGFRQLFVPMLRALPDAGEKEAEAICRSIRTLASLRIAHNDDEVTIQRLTFMNFSSSRNIRHYAGLTRAFHRNPPPEQRRLVYRHLCQHVPTFMMCFADDEVVGTKLVSQLAFERSRLATELHQKGGHFAPYRCPDVVCESIARFFDSLALNKADGLAS